VAALWAMVRFGGSVDKCSWVSLSSFCCIVALATLLWFTILNLVLKLTPSIELCLHCMWLGFLG
jgi:hypothetical protein